MQSQKEPAQNQERWRQRCWVLAIIAVASILLMARQPLLAADAGFTINQPGGTVPPPTPRPEVPDPGDDGNDDDDDVMGSATEEQPAAPVEVAEQTTGAPSELTAVVNTETLNVRQGPGTTFAVVGVLTRGDIVTVAERDASGEWWLVCCAGGSETRGWVSRTLLAPNFESEQADALPLSATMVAPALGATEAAADTGTGAAAGTEAATETAAEAAIDAAPDAGTAVDALAEQADAEPAGESALQPAAGVSTDAPSALPATGGETSSWPLAAAGLVVGALAVSDAVRRRMAR